MMKSSKEGVKIGDWEYQAEYGRLVNGSDVEHFVEKRLNRLLQILIAHKGSIIKREEIIEYVWGEVQVNEENLTKGMFDLRKMLKDKGIQEIEIVTIRGIGYQLEIRDEEKDIGYRKKTLMKVAMFAVMAIAFLILFIRAIRYEN